MTEKKIKNIYKYKYIWNIFFYLFFYFIYLFIFFIIIIFRYAIAYLRTGSYAPGLGSNERAKRLLDISTGQHQLCSYSIYIKLPT